MIEALIMLPILIPVAFAARAWRAELALNPEPTNDSPSYNWRQRDARAAAADRWRDVWVSSAPLCVVYVMRWAAAQ